MMPLYFILPILTQWFIRLITLFWWKGVLKLRITGRDNLLGIPKKVIFAPNHLSDWDGPLVRSSLPMFSRFSPMFYVSLPKRYYEGKERDIIRRTLWGGRIFKIVGAYPVYKGKNSLDETLKNHIKILHDGGSLCIFPEGKRSIDGEIGEFKIGVSYLAYKFKVPIIPVLLKGTNNSKKSDGPATVTFGKPMYYENDTTPSTEELEKFSEKIRKAVNDLDN